ncbi:STAS domain-containing protein [Streptomyces sp. 8N706]|uniref:STAS domain-containing protein n=1 Tax=Streptomyces sp. 8N706 TaxID=3457416 RepID=UPI003FD4A6EA
MAGCDQPPGSPAGAPGRHRAAGEAATIVVVLAPPLRRADLPRQCERLRTLLHDAHAGPVTVDVGALTDPDVLTIEALARLELTARRLGHRVRLRHACEALRDLLDFAGLGDVLPTLAEPATPAAPTQAEQALPGPAPAAMPVEQAAPGPAPTGLRREPRGETEEREEPCGVEEGIEPDDTVP